MSKVLVVYFSVSGVTKKAAEEIANAEQGTLFEILPEVLYTAEDLDWKNKQSRSTLEMQDPGCRPPVVGKVENMAQYDEDDLDRDIVHGASFMGVWYGNLKVIPVLIEGWTAEQFEDKLTGVLYGPRPTSCADQLAKAVRAAYEAEKSA